MLAKVLEWISKPKLPTRHISLDEAVAKFTSTPSAWFLCHGEEYSWPDPDSTHGFGLSNVNASVHGHHLADMEVLYVQGSTLTIGHLGVQTHVVQRGVGKALVKAFAKEVGHRYGVSRIVFAENATNYHQKGYGKFFARIGATALPIDPLRHKPNRPDFEWLEANW